MPVMVAGCSPARRARAPGLSGPCRLRSSRQSRSTSLSATWVPTGLTRRFTTAGEALAKPAGQTLARWLVLETIQDKPATVAQIARSLQLARQGVQRLADVLVRDSLAAYEDNPAHRRAKLLRITPQGRRALRAIQTAQAAWADTLGAEIGEAQLRQASILLDRVLQAVGRHPPDAPPTDSA